MDYTVLAKVPLFKGVEGDDLEEILTDLNIGEVFFDKGDILAMQDEPCNRLIILLTGKVKGEMTDPAGKLVKVEDIEAPSPLAILFLFGSHNRFPVQATAMEKISALVIPKRSVLKMLGKSEMILRNYLDISANFASTLSRKLHLMSFRTIRQKLAIYLLDLLSATDSDTVELGKTKTALAEYFGVSRPSLERELSLMQRDGLIESGRGTIRVPSRRRLASVL